MRSLRTSSKSLDESRVTRFSNYRPLGLHIPLASLIHVLAVAEYLSFRHAANVLGVTQSSVSTRIKGLEETLGVLLFERRHRGVRLTDAGRRFVTEVTAGINHLDRAIKTAGSMSAGTLGLLGIGSASSVGDGYLAELRVRFRKDHPGIEQIMVEGPSAETVAMVRNGKLDVTFVPEQIDAPDCHSRYLWSESFLIAMAADHALANYDSIFWHDLIQETFLIRVGGAGPQLFEHLIRRMSERGRSPHVRQCDVGRGTLMHMVACGEGVTLTSSTAKNTQCAGVVLRSIADESEQARFKAIWSPHNRSQALKELLDLAVATSRSTYSS